MLSGDEFEHLGYIALRFEQHRANAVSDGFGGAFEHYGMFQDPCEQFGRPQLLLDLVMAARSSDDDLSISGDTFVDRVVGGGVARVEGDQNIDISEFGFGNRALNEVEPVEAAGFCDVVAEQNEFGAEFDACDRDTRCRRGRPRSQIIVQSEGKVALAGAHIDDPQVRFAL
jgi:hypothetical protein